MGDRMHKWARAGVAGWAMLVAQCVMVTPATAAVSSCLASASAAEAESPFLTAEVSQIDGRRVISWMTRGASHVEIAPGEPLGGAHYMVADVFADPPGDLGDIQELIDSGRGDEVLLRLNRGMVSSPPALRAYSALFHLLAQDTDGAALFYCTAGKDRTGWAAAVLLALLGVPKETVYRDYLLSNGYRSNEIAAGIGTRGAAFAPLERVAPEYLDAAFDEVDRRYGSFDNYPREGLGLDEKTLTNLKNKFLQSGPA